MDSSNSGSFQSSSGGAGGGGGGGDNEEYDSRTQSISSFLNPSNHFNQNLNHLLQQPSQHHNHHHPPPTNTTNTFFNPSSSPFSPNPNPVQDLSSIWAGSSLPSYPTNPNPNLNPTSMDNNINTKTGHGSDHNHNQVGVMTKNPKKRTRASRRAPTTVLTTDTTNFRQMVQEFTGIPTAPFTTAPFSRRLDLFNTLRPSVQKIQHAPPYLNTTHNMVENSTTTSNYNIPPSTIHDFQKQPSTLLDLQNPMLSFQSLLQQNNVSQHGNELSGFPSSSKRWRSENDKMENFEGVIGNNQNIGGSKLNSGLENVGDQVQGNEGSWICPSS